MAKQYFYFASYVGSTDKKECNGNYRINWDEKINSEERFLKFNDFIRQRASEDSNGIPASAIVIMSIQLLN